MMIPNWLSFFRWVDPTHHVCCLDSPLDTPLYKASRNLRAMRDPLRCSVAEESPEEAQ